MARHRAGRRCARGHADSIALSPTALRGRPSNRRRESLADYIAQGRRIRRTQHSICALVISETVDRERLDLDRAINRAPKDTNVSKQTVRPNACHHYRRRYLIERQSRYWIRQAATSATELMKENSAKEQAIAENDMQCRRRSREYTASASCHVTLELSQWNISTRTKRATCANVSLNQKEGVAGAFAIPTTTNDKRYYYCYTGWTPICASRSILTLVNIVHSPRRGRRLVKLHAQYRHVIIYPVKRNAGGGGGGGGWRGGVISLQERVEIYLSI
ncbi:hypothetical protein EVAR_17677_1 [Eumeta japonica]|uniref:Uncharacterized protein n=1 Tax=Eumeta variegata TaxID=151549 RepID=A0A4C1US41_EUMVA|nr:hypothetical protein EVAR_17677_1 [Eumeta japonica]